MTLAQLEYIIAVDTYGSFVAAAEKCFVTQPTLSMQIQKLEESLDAKLFDRSKHPVAATEVGEKIIHQARIVLTESKKITDLVQDSRGIFNGDLKIGVIPTAAPYLLPHILPELKRKYPKLHIYIWEYTSDKIIKLLKNGTLDCGILSTPLHDSELKEDPLFYETFVAYVSESSGLYKKTQVKSKDIIEEKLWLLNEGHCMRGQVLNICNYRNLQSADQFLEYNTGSIESLKRMVDVNGGVTIIPELSIQYYTEDILENIRYFHHPEPVREMSIVTPHVFAKKRVIAGVKNVILDYVPDKFKTKKKKNLMTFEL
ncbi:MAG TPA: LysR substrate-binding domain-containing protein [Sphingobacterium sp.]|nr:LysR substrate-binding domain-containing protein [Sphingobacterium sp.]